MVKRWEDDLKTKLMYVRLRSAAAAAFAAAYDLKTACRSCSTWHSVTRNKYTCLWFWFKPQSVDLFKSLLHENDCD